MVNIFEQLKTRVNEISLFHLREVIKRIFNSSTLSIDEAEVNTIMAKISYFVVNYTEESIVWMSEIQDSLLSFDDETFLVNLSIPNLDIPGYWKRYKPAESNLGFITFSELIRQSITSGKNILSTFGSGLVINYFLQIIQITF